ncbi:hypothetical protein MKZ38_002531 [Zalerion maritima]|uniref:D-serine dehydratase n=1 Tax=Zalerion maritima TaxID=339359 RepID=A0AAD5RNR5_9PEZI|nr:hypothetical protein MKZ38_002531 [Zalerion maritima]
MATLPPHLEPESFIGRPLKELPTPALILSKPVMERNAEVVLEDVEKMGLGLRVHVKTLKSAEATKIATGNGKHKTVVASTLAEIRGLVPLAREGIVEEVAYGMPLPPSALEEVGRLSQFVKIVLFVDHVEHIEVLERYCKGSEDGGAKKQKWNVFIKVDAGYGRAGVPVSVSNAARNHSKRFEEVVRRVLKSEVVQVCGLYTHSGHTYGAKSQAYGGIDEEESVQDIMKDEVNTLLKAAELLPEDGQFILSFGATPQAHVVRALMNELGEKGRLRRGLRLELHAGNFIAKDLQQVSTGCCCLEDQALRLLVEVCSVYPERNEVLVNGGRLALTSEISPGFPGFGLAAGASPAPGAKCREKTRAEGEKGRDSAGKWYVRKVSQEHGIMCPCPPPLSDNGAHGDGERAKVEAEESWSVGDKTLLYVSHACITAAAHPWYYVVDKHDVVREVWRPWRGW